MEFDLIVLTSMTILWQKITALAALRKNNRLPETPGVYFFLDAEKKLLYIGKASSLRDRVKSYFSQDMAETRGPKIVRMLEQVGFVAHRQTDSVLEALILESALIKGHQPPYNTDAKDDKSYQHVVITQEQFPRVLIVRGRDLENQQLTLATSSVRGQATNNQQPKKEYQYVFGPFPSGGALREALRIIRKLFPFRDKCLPAEALAKEGKPVNSQQETVSKTKDLESFWRGKVPKQVRDTALRAKPCFSAQIGLCPGVCTGAVSAREYQQTINHIRLFFEGRKPALIRKLEQEMRMAVKQLNFEKAGEIKKTLFALRHIQDVTLLKDDWQSVGSREQPTRIEAYDVAHLGGNASVGVMVVLEDGRPVKDAYRKFILRGEHNGNDLTALAEILIRRFRHTEWRLPDIIVIDGADPQVETAKQALLHLAVKPPSDIAVVGVVKNAKHQPERLIGDEDIILRYKKEILLANSEAHRFAITFHRHRRTKEFL